MKHRTVNRSSTKPKPVPAKKSPASNTTFPASLSISASFPEPIQASATPHKVSPMLAKFHATLDRITIDTSFENYEKEKEKQKLKQQEAEFRTQLVDKLLRTQ
eukprot:TRINITY_DN6143_c0_g1_i6.p1 TRINITY_DN6143_c0_g1~~TRINITY_DN6143_c0_g1_i6.p1  ORF type:complete len:103 (-),score=12.57 TRINITY_DN6143_c0_g1_i6:44-352(-)